MQGHDLMILAQDQNQKLSSMEIATNYYPSYIFPTTFTFLSKAQIKCLELTMLCYVSPGPPRIGHNLRMDNNHCLAGVSPFCQYGNCIPFWHKQRKKRNLYMVYGKYIRNKSVQRHLVVEQTEEITPSALLKTASSVFTYYLQQIKESILVQCFIAVAISYKDFFKNL